ncbi:MAG: sigma-70 family RNA polymerase sigma factor [Chitinophagaceae bacterium]|nr:MAG: sigma-70 family RNA polymerase sigma factor [Chitinophagaceae bacterium]
MSKTLYLFYLTCVCLHSALPDIELWNAFIDGDKEAFSVLFRRFYPLLFQYGSKITTDNALLEDTIQELFLELWRKQPAQRLLSVKAYLLQALKFKLYKTFRNKNLISSLDEDGFVFELSSETLLIDSEEDIERSQKIFAALDQLSPRQKEVIYLKIYKGLSYEEVSDVMQLNYQVVRNLLYTALKAFKKLCALLAIQLIFLTVSFC